MSKNKAIDILDKHSLLPSNNLGHFHSTRKQTIKSNLFQTFEMPIPKSKQRIPSQKWQEKALDLVCSSESYLQNDRRLEVWKWLYGRGLKDETIKKARLGWNSSDRLEGRKTWGLQEEKNKKGGYKKLWLPEGLVIPIFNWEGKVMRLRIGRFSQKPPKYYIITGSNMITHILGEAGKPLIICETELDGWLINQEAGNIVTVASLGSLGIKPDSLLMLYLLIAPKILISLDADNPGKSASEWWLKNFPKAKYWPVPWSKDPGDAFGYASQLIKNWIRLGISQDKLY